MTHCILILIGASNLLGLLFVHSENGRPQCSSNGDLACAVSHPTVRDGCPTVSVFRAIAIGHCKVWFELEGTIGIAVPFHLTALISLPTRGV